MAENMLFVILITRGINGDNRGQLGDCIKESLMYDHHGLIGGTVGILRDGLEGIYDLVADSFDGSLVVEFGKNNVEMLEGDPINKVSGVVNNVGGGSSGGGSGGSMFGSRGGARGKEPDMVLLKSVTGILKERSGIVSR
ncbi:hypothetical protein L2E82_31049 [Cichorium intybus]|uniref:Uncharacterized protein n=1 Tax=Cichorium intybus TaxID=13427 RepID=A0ACB9D250_CICIN|nr:hypothetical protein L2E82_31049 [Cichorium intybus]